ncbi:50S ribosomal protein L11 [candidate division WOR-3 bacterium]|nr:50S ribosomal protein L11 [candidate division WOR-3 bacterium]MCK4585338.1 50S ribosomal protein L11 [candidate division WOR-3 bacterium]TET78261.1 MAG: 50S ribosomal protein L11 [Candidatus Cloacimonadota bacterium]
MVKKPVERIIKLHVPAGEATLAPPVGPALGQHLQDPMKFCREFNEKTKGKEGLIIPVIITVYKNKTFSFITKTPLASILLKRAAGLAKGSPQPNKEKVGKVTMEEVKKIAQEKMKDLNADTIESAVKIIEGTARSMGIVVV